MAEPPADSCPAKVCASDLMRDAWTASVGQTLAQVMIAMRREVDLRMMTLGLTEAQWKPLWMLSVGQSSTAFEISREMGVDAGALTRMLDRLEAKGLIERERSESDRRVVHLHLTPAGQVAARQIPEILAAVNRDLLKEFSADEVTLFRSMLARLARNLQSIQHPAGPEA